ncbi:hypothetical protein DXG01_013798 [Tephrocybe rancida]|nr:hypothetical protein DXG01_013798 [Tephrocybe rancida]
MKFFSILVLVATSVAVVAAANVNACKKDANDIRPLVEFLRQAIKDVPPNGPTISQGIKIQTSVSNTKKKFDDASNNCRGASFSGSDSKAILNSVENYTEPLLQLLRLIIEKKRAILSMPFPGIEGLVRSALDGMHRSNGQFNDAWIGSSTNDVKPRGNSIKTETEAAYNKAVTAYSN